MKIRETRTVPEGFAGRREERVRELAAGEALPEGAVQVPDDTEVYDWRRAEGRGG